MQQLRGRNLTHIGCTLGLSLGLFLGMLFAIVVLNLSATAAGAAFWVFALVTVIVGALGYYAGVVATRRFSGEQRPRK
jgi:ABC-type xylose transport system permease subunit